MTSPTFGPNDQLGLRLAAKYGITVHPVPSCPRKLAALQASTGELGERGPEVHTYTRTATREVWIEPWTHEPEVLFHEVAHVLLNPPDFNPQMVDEGWLLLQGERCLARALATKEEYECVLWWQEDTLVRPSGRTPTNLGEFDNLRLRPFWRNGFKLLREMGFLTANNWPTWEWPDWSRIDQVPRS